MKRIIVPVLLGMCWMALEGTTVHAQMGYVRPPTAPTPRPAFSPYLNLARGGNAAINYYGLVRPQVDTAASLQRLQREINQGMIPSGQPTMEVLQNGAPTTPITGHSVRFFNLNPYFTSNPSRTPTLSRLTIR